MKLNNNLISSIDQDAFKYMTYMNDLNLANNRLASFPQIFYDDYHHNTTTPLITLNLSNNQLVALSNELDSLSSLVSIDLSGNQISSLPSTYFKYNTKLENIDLSNNVLGVVLEKVI